MRELRRLLDVAFQPIDFIREVQTENLREHLQHCRDHSPYYQNVFKNLDIPFESITLDQVKDLPFTEKSDLARFNDQFLAAPMARIVDVVLSSGTAGQPTRIMYTEHDLQRLAYNEERAFAGCGVTAEDVVLLTCTIDRCFVAGLAYFLGVRSLGATAIRNGSNSLESHCDLIRRLKPTVVVGVPSFVRKLGLFLQSAGINPRDTGVSRIIGIGEPLRGRDLNLLTTGRDIESIWEAKVYSTYASSEIVTTFCECEAQKGGHKQPDLGLVEIVDDDGRLLPAGLSGEVVVTPFSVEGMPLLRFRTGDVSFLIEERCPCGRNTPRLGPILGRKNQMIKVRGTTLYPQQIYSALEEAGDVCEYYVEVAKESELADLATVHLAVKDRSLTAESIQGRLQAKLRVKLQVEVEDREAIERAVFSPKSRKPIRFVDKR